MVVPLIENLRNLVDNILKLLTASCQAVGEPFRQAAVGATFSHELLNFPSQC